MKPCNNEQVALCLEKMGNLQWLITHRALYPQQKWPRRARVKNFRVYTKKLSFLRGKTGFVGADKNLKCIFITFERLYSSLPQEGSSSSTVMLWLNTEFQKWGHFTCSNRTINDSLNQMVFWGWHINLGVIRNHAVIKINQNKKNKIGAKSNFWLDSEVVG